VGHHLKALVFAPTVELAQQIQREFRFFGVGLARKVRTKFFNELDQKYDWKEQFAQSTDVLVCTPLRFLKQMKRFSESLKSLEFVVFDEADRFFEAVYPILSLTNRA